MTGIRENLSGAGALGIPELKVVEPAVQSTRGGTTRRGCRPDDASLRSGPGCDRRGAPWRAMAMTSTVRSAFRRSIASATSRSDSV
jgi:hypothetical protein